VPVLPGCEGAPATGYANGRIPASSLCRIPGAKGHALRADAARAFVALSAAHEAERGAPLCLTDTYRSYEAQVRLRWAKRGLAAPPGTSNHGDGTAVDMCGGVESFGTAAHRWMRENAGRFGWVHPSWAGPRGKRPEPWHWEYRD
jgi:LAS superfamily LD-carboxypeptidase LdcB